MNVLFLTAEMSPLVKVGGLGDVAGALPQALLRLGLDVRVALPMYATLAHNGLVIEQVATTDAGSVHETSVNGVPVYLLEHPASFDRDQVYGFDDDLERFLAFCDALLSAAEAIGWQPDIIHLNDWHGGFLPILLAAEPDHPWASIPRILTIHNLGHRGDFSEEFAEEHKLDVSTNELPAKDVVYSALAQAILSSHSINAVSPTYAREILTPKFGGDLAPLLQLQSDRLSGILNGIDTDLFNPAVDPHLVARFDVHHLDPRVGNKRSLQDRLNLDRREDVPLVGMVTRLFEQKGTDLIPDAIEPLLASGALQLAVLGQGDPVHERVLVELAARHPARAAVELAFDEALGQLIYGGSDMFLMPSRYEPCGLGQMIAMRYGSIPVVRRTGGLADSVPPYDHDSKTGTGFLFDETTPEALRGALDGALAVYRDKSAWRALQVRAMYQDVSWDRSAVEYQKMYERARASRAAGARTA